MTDDILIRREGRVGRITLNRPNALNALTPAMVTAIDGALRDWADDPAVAMLVLDAAGEKAFCAGGDLTEIYESGRRGDHAAARRFWRDEYRMNARLYEFPKPVASFLQGYTMGGGVGVGCHGSHRVVGDGSRIAMPEVAIGIVPDVGGSLILARAPGRLGEYLAVTTFRMGPGDAIRAGFATHYVPEAEWPDLIARLVETGEPSLIDTATRPAPEAALAALQPRIDAAFGATTLAGIVQGLRADGDDFADDTLARMARNDPLAMAASVEIVRRVRGSDDVRVALELEYRFTHRAPEDGDLLEGIRALIIDKDKRPRWRHDDIGAVPDAAVARMLQPLGDDGWRFDDIEETAP